jgi:hypothetical protein
VLAVGDLGGLVEALARPGVLEPDLLDRGDRVAQARDAVVHHVVVGERQGGEPSVGDRLGGRAAAREVDQLLGLRELVAAVADDLLEVAGDVVGRQHRRHRTEQPVVTAHLGDLFDVAGEHQVTDHRGGEDGVVGELGRLGRLALEEAGAVDHTDQQQGDGETDQRVASGTERGAAQPTLEATAAGRLGRVEWGSGVRHRRLTRRRG